jgi:MFS transporter, FLVCR family, MFS-domain-containing protein 7
MSTWHATSKILALSIISTVVVPLGLLIVEAPPTPPSRDSLSSYAIQVLWSESRFILAYSGSRIPSPSIISLLRAAVGLSCPPEAYMTLRERLDFAILVTVFSSFVAASVFSWILFCFPPFLTFTASVNTFSVLSSQWMVCMIYNCMSHSNRSRTAHLVSIRLFG